MSRCAPRPGAGQLYLSLPFDGREPELQPLERSALAAALDPVKLFGSERPFELEIGFGKARALIAAAKSQPDQPWLGIELSLPYMNLAAERASKAGLRNLRLLRAEASEVLRFGVKPGTLAGVHIFCPDPWPKKRHHKRRLIQDSFLVLVETVLKPGGRLRIATDHPGYFEEIAALMAARTSHWTEDPDAWGDHTPTNYEVKYEKEGKPIYRTAHRLKQAREPLPPGAFPDLFAAEPASDAEASDDEASPE